jgi:hypothetical protein
MAKKTPPPTDLPAAKTVSKKKAETSTKEVKTVKKAQKL